MSECGELEFFIYPALSPKILNYKQQLLTGKIEMPPFFALGYH
jgi:hypothetical protein